MFCLFTILHVSPILNNPVGSQWNKTIDIHEILKKKYHKVGIWLSGSVSFNSTASSYPKSIGKTLSWLLSEDNKGGVNCSKGKGCHQGGLFPPREGEVLSLSSCLVESGKVNPTSIRWSQCYWGFKSQKILTKLTPWNCIQKSTSNWCSSYIFFSFAPSSYSRLLAAAKSFLSRIVQKLLAIVIFLGLRESDWLTHSRVQGMEYWI